MQHSLHRIQRTKSLTVHILLLFIVFICLFPILWMCIISIKSPSETISGFSSLIIEKPTLDNFKNLFSLVPVAQNAFNSIFTTFMGTITTLFFCSLAGFAFAKYNFPGRHFLFYFLIATMMIPPEVGAIPLFVIMRKIELINSLWSLIIPRAATAVGIFYMRQYIIGVPNEIIEAAKIDGCSDFGIYTRVVVPVIKPALASWAVLTLIARWNDFFWPILFLRSQSKFTLMVSLSLLPVSDGFSTPWQTIMAGATFVIIPIILFYLLLQRFQSTNLTAGAVKG